MENKTSKYVKYAIGEIVLVVIGILIALQVNNWNESRKEQKQIRLFAKSLVDDLYSDIAMLEISKSQAENKYKAIDSLRHMISHAPIKELSNTDLYIITHDIIYRPYKWNRSNLNELKNSGGLRFITNDSILKKLVAYESFSNHLDEDFEFDKTNSLKADDIIISVLNLNNPYFNDLRIKENEGFYDRTFNLYETEEYKQSKQNDLPLISYDKEKLQKLTNTFILIQDNYRVRALNEMPEIIENAKELIELLKLEYLTND
ncbi:DUF6090 family protein [Aegicerativicinus sediminis]